MNLYCKWEEYLEDLQSVKVHGASHITAQPRNHVDSAQPLCLYTVAQGTALRRIL